MDRPTFERRPPVPLRPDPPMCETCPHWHDSGDPARTAIDGNMGACHRFPKVMTYCIQQGTGALLSFWCYPEMEWWEDCGEHPSFPAYLASLTPPACPKSDDDAIDDLIARWHAGEGGGLPLHEFLGVPREAYAAWVEGRGELTPRPASLTPPDHPEGRIDA